MKKKKLIITIIIAAIIIAVIIAIVIVVKNNLAGTYPVAETGKVELKEMTNTVDCNGTVEYDDTSVIYAQTNAKITMLKAKIGDSVNAGDTIIEYDKDALDDLKNQLDDAKLSLKESQIALAKLQNPADNNELKQSEIKINQAKSNIQEAKYRLSQLESSIKQAKINVENAQKDYNNNKTLYESGVISKDEFDKYDKALVEAQNTLEGNNSQYEAEKLTISTAETNLTSAETDYDTLINKTKLNDNQKEIEAQKVQIEKAQLKISQLEKDIADFHMTEKAEITGTIVKVSAKEGEIPAQGTALVEIARSEDLIIKADIDEYDMKNIALGQSAEVTGDSFTGKIDAKISKIYPMAEEKQKNGTNKTMTTVELAIDSNKLNLLKAGYTIKAKITTKTTPNAKVVPLTAVMTDTDSNDYVYSLDKNNVVIRKDIEIIGYADMYVEIDGLNENDVVLTQPDNVALGATVTPMNSADITVNEE